MYSATHNRVLVASYQLLCYKYNECSLLSSSFFIVINVIKSKLRLFSSLFSVALYLLNSIWVFYYANGYDIYGIMI